jgi:hypothetical protein
MFFNIFRVIFQTAASISASLVFALPRARITFCNQSHRTSHSPRQFFFSNGATAPSGHGLLIIEASRSHSDTPLGRTPLDEWSARRRDLYLTTHNTYERQTSMPPAGFEPTIPASERPQTHALDRAAIGIGIHLGNSLFNYVCDMVYYSTPYHNVMSFNTVSVLKYHAICGQISVQKKSCPTPFCHIKK